MSTPHPLEGGAGPPQEQVSPSGGGSDPPKSKCHPLGGGSGPPNTGAGRLAALPRVKHHLGLHPGALV